MFWKILAKKEKRIIFHMWSLLPSSSTFIDANRTYPYQISVSKRKTTVISVSRQGIHVKTNRHMKLKDLQAFIQSKAKQLVQKLQAFETEAHTYQNGDYFWFLGNRYTLGIHEGKRDQVVLDPPNMIVETAHLRPITIQRILKTWYLQQAEKVFQERLKYCLETFQKHSSLKPKLVIKSFKTRWGHMTKDQVMALNLQLIQVPIAFIDSVIFHELTHLLHFHHQKAFHEMLEQLVPQHRQVNRDLKAFYQAIRIL